MTLWISEPRMTRYSRSVKVQEDLELLNQQLGLLILERQQDSQPVNQHSEHEPESAPRVKRDLSEVEFESTMKRKRFGVERLCVNSGSGK